MTMQQRELSNQAELVHQLDPEPVFDYLLQHRALDQCTVDLIKDEEKISDRNIKLLKHLEELGNPAIELFINALRQSGQMHLASVLDVEHRIKPVVGTGYWEKQRYKGQVTISFQLLAAKVLVRKDSEEDRSPRIVDINAMLTPFKMKHSYENMTLIGENENGPKARKILEYSYEEEEDKSCWCCFFCCGSRARRKKQKQKEKEREMLEMQRSAELNESKNGANTEKTSSSLDLYDVMVSLPSQPSSPIKSGSTFFKSRRLSPTIETSETQSLLSKTNSVDRNSNHHLSEMSSTPNTPSEMEKEHVGVKFDAKHDIVSITSRQSEKSEKSKHSEKSEKSKHSEKSEKSKHSEKSENSKFSEKSDKSKQSEKAEKSKKKSEKKNMKKSDSIVEMNKKNGNVLSENGDSVAADNKENSDPLIIDVSKNGLDKHKGKSKIKSSAKLSPPTSLNTSKSPTGMKRSETYELVERWRSEGCAYQTTRDHFFTFFDNNIQSRIVRYFEQERSTLVLQVGLKDGMSVCTICMTTREVKKLREDYEMGVLHEELVRCVNPQDVVDKMECLAIHLRTVIDDEDFTLSYQELS